jgi:hypothetical protein
MEIEEIAKEWAKREYFRQSMTGSLDPALTEEDYTQQAMRRKNWPRLRHNKNGSK